MKKTTTSLCMAGFAALALSACGGGDSPSPAPAPAVTEAVPASASGSVTGFIDYLQALVKATADTLEPVSLANVAPPASETDEPAKVD